MLTAVALGAEPQVGTPTVAYVQATVAEPNPSAESLSFVSASGRASVARVGGAARSSLSNLRVGDEVILTLEGSVITAVKVSRLVQPAAAAEAVAAVPMVIPGASRPSWPNPYSRINPGLPIAPARGRAGPTRGRGTLSVMPAGLVTPARSAPPQGIAAPAVLNPVAALPLAAAAVPPPRAEIASTVDVLRARGARDFEAAVSRLAAEARTVDSVYARYEAACPTAATAAQEGSREWFGLWDGQAVSGASAACAPLMDEMARLGAPIRAGLLAAQESARRAWVLPGTMRDIRRRHAMEWSGFDR
jgi:hypothetical protein